VTLNLAETSVVKSRPSVRYEANLFDAVVSVTGREFGNLKQPAVFISNVSAFMYPARPTVTPEKKTR